MIRFLFALILLGMPILVDTMSPVRKEPLYVELASNIREKLARSLSKKYHMDAVGTHGGLMHQVNMLGLGFDITGPLSKEQLRRIIVGCVQEFLTTINSNEEIRPFLKNYPFTPNNIEIYIFVNGPTRDSYDLYYPNISVASTFDGRVFYKTNDPDHKFKYKTTEEESYAEALKIVQLETFKKIN